MRNLKMIVLVVFLIALLPFKGYSKNVIESQIDSLIEKYAILQINMTSKVIRVYFEDGDKKEYPVAFGESLSYYNNEKVAITLLKRFSDLKKEGYFLVDSFEDKPSINFVFIKTNFKKP
jgi:hypothetical protein